MATTTQTVTLNESELRNLVADIVEAALTNNESKVIVLLLMLDSLVKKGRNENTISES